MVPDREALQTSINKLPFDLKLDPKFAPFEDEGFSPCTLDGENDIGFEILYTDSKDVTQDDLRLKNIAGDRNYCISLTWRGDFKDCASAMIVCAALAKDFHAVVSYEGEEPNTFDQLIESARHALKEAESTSSNPELESKKQFYAESHNVEKHFDEAVESINGARITKAMIRHKELYVTFENGNWIKAPTWNTKVDKQNVVEHLIDGKVVSLSQHKSSLMCALKEGFEIEFARKDSGKGFKVYPLLYSKTHNVSFEVHWQGPFISELHE